jgi:hypothetical protein
MFLVMAASGIRMQGIPEILVQMDRSERPHLMRGGARVSSDQRQVLRQISAECKLPLSLRLHIFSNQYVREAAALGRREAAYLVLRALLLWPGNREAYAFLLRKASAVLSRVSGIRHKDN